MRIKWVNNIEWGDDGGGGSGEDDIDSNDDDTEGLGSGLNQRALHCFPAAHRAYARARVCWGTHLEREADINKYSKTWWGEGIGEAPFDGMYIFWTWSLAVVFIFGLPSVYSPVNWVTWNIRLIDL